MSRDDLLAIEIPVPSMKVQESLERELQRGFAELVALRQRLDALPEAILRGFLGKVESAILL